MLFCFGLGKSMHQDPSLALVGGVTKLLSCHCTETTYEDFLTDVLGLAFEDVLFVAETAVSFSMINRSE